MKKLMDKINRGNLDKLIGLGSAVFLLGLFGMPALEVVGLLIWAVALALFIWLDFRLCVRKYAILHGVLLVADLAMLVWVLLR